LTSGKPQPAKDKPSANKKHGEGDKDRPEKFHLTNESIRVEVDLSPGVVDKYDAANKEAATREKKKHLLERLALFAGFGVLAVYIFQLCAMQGQLNTMKQTLMMDQRAWIKTKIDAPADAIADQEFKGMIYITNNGKTPAKQITGIFKLEVVSGQSSPSFDLDNRAANAGIPFIFSSDTEHVPAILLQNRPDNPTRGVPATLSVSDAERLKNGDAYVAIYGRLDYWDIFRQHHWIRFCSWRTYSPPGFQPKGIAALDCMRFNDIDNE
jgi:hypothetical protein